MFVIRLANGNLMVPESALAKRGQLMGDAYVEIGPEDADYARLAVHAITEQQLEERRRSCQDGDAALQRQFAEFLASQDGDGERGGRS